MFVLMLLAACSGSSEIVGDATAGETLYADNCVVCHGDDGTAGIGGAADLTFEINDAGDASISDTILNGNGDMAAVAGLDEQDAADIIAYMHQAFGG
jgi:mono/diheme cytochrome c family protein